MAKKIFAAVAVVFLVALLSAGAFLYRNGGNRQKSVRQASPPPATNPLQVVLTPLGGEDALDKEIRSLQRKIAESPDHDALLERLGWAFVAKARLTSDPGFYNLAEQAGKAIAEQTPAAPGKALLLGHIADAQHRFADAEKIARQLTSQRNFVFDYALLGDALMEQGKLIEAVEAYQKMVDLKPCLQTYSRVAYMRWLKGDLPGAIQATRLAVSAGSPREPEPTAWAYTRLALYENQAGNAAHASTDLDLALQFAPDYAPALLMRGKLLLGEGRAAEAIAPLRTAAEKSPLPDYLWTLSEALRSSGQIEEAQKVETQLAKSGATADPRTYALFLSSRRENPAEALRLAKGELETRRDIFTYDALAWAQLASGQVKEARQNSLRALAEGTQDARLFYHAGAIAAADGDNAEALKFLNQAHGIEQLLLPSEKAALGQTTASVLAVTSHLSSK